MGKTNPQPPYRLQLRLLAIYNDTNSLSEKDRKLISALLRHLADGEKVNDFFGSHNPAHRPTSSLVDQRIWDVCSAMAPEDMGGRGLSRAEAIRSVASDHKIDEERIIENLKTTRGKELFGHFSSVFRKP